MERYYQPEIETLPYEKIREIQNHEEIHWKRTVVIYKYDHLCAGLCTGSE